MPVAANSLSALLAAADAASPSGAADDGGAGIRRPLSSFNVSRLIAADLQLASAFQDTDLVE
jgi:hypothetical protein